MQDQRFRPNPKDKLMNISTAISSDHPTDLTDPVMYDNPWPTFERLRAVAPVAPAKTRMARRRAMIVTRYDDVVSLYKDPRFSNDVMKQGRMRLIAAFTPRVFRLLTESMVFKDDPDHRRLRGLVDRTFTPRMIATLTQSIEAITAALIDRMTAPPAFQSL